METLSLKRPPVVKGEGLAPWLRLVREPGPSPFEDVKTQEREPVKCPRDAWRYCKHMETYEVEHFVVLCLDAQHRVVACVEVSRGVLNSSLVHPREVFRMAILMGAASIVLVHNHPSGDPTPSADDRAITTQLIAAGRLLDMPVNDHVVVGRDRYVSFAEAGLM